MQVVSTYIYKSFTIELSLSENNLFYASSIHFYAPNKRHGYDTAKEARIEIERQLDEYLLTAPKTIKELASYITDSLIWTGYEDCYCETSTLIVLLVNYLKSNGIDETVIDKLK